MKTFMTVLTVVMIVTVSGGRVLGQVRERLAPAGSHRASFGPKQPQMGPSGPTTRPSTPKVRPNPPQVRPNPPARTVVATPANPLLALRQRLGLTPGMSSATGRVVAVGQNGQVLHTTGTYKVTADGRIMIFPAGSDVRLDLHSGMFNARTNVVGAKYTGINLTAGRNTGGGGINLSLSGSGSVNAEIQEWYTMVGNQTMEVSSQRQLIRFIPN